MFPDTNEFPGYDTKLSDGKVLALELWGMCEVDF